MKITRFIANDMRSALRKVSETLGPDAVILSNNRVDEGVEIVAAIDYDESLLQEPEKKSQVQKQASNPFIKDDEEVARAHIEQRNREAALDDIRFGRNIPEPSLETAPVMSHAKTQSQVKDHLWSEQPAFLEMQTELKSLRGMLVNQLSGLSWGNEVQYHPLRARLLQRLMSLGLSPKLAKDIATQVNEEKDFDHNWRLALGELAHQVPVGENEIIEKGGIVALVGATGVGKTTTIAKLAARYTLKHGPHRVALITTDNYRVAAQEQLRSYARIMGVPMRVTGDAESLRAVLDSLHDKELILIDTAGMSQRDIRISEQFSVLKETKANMKVFLVMAATSQLAGLEETINVFRGADMDGCILTKLDEAASLGPAISAIIEQKLPLAYVSDGQRVPEDLHRARVDKLVNQGNFDMNKRKEHSIEELMRHSMGRTVSNAH